MFAPSLADAFFNRLRRDAIRNIVFMLNASTTIGSWHGFACFCVITSPYKITRPFKLRACPSDGWNQERSDAEALFIASDAHRLTSGYPNLLVQIDPDKNVKDP